VLLQETARRLEALACLSFPVSPFRERVVPAHGTQPDALTTGQQEILTHATGRRTARDIAFAVGRSVYPITAEISRMLGDGLLEIAAATNSFSFSYWGVTSLRPRTAIPQDIDQPDEESLPTRRPGTSADDTDQEGPLEWRTLSRLLSLLDTERKRIEP
jgi:hypothetical protein